MSDDRHNVGEPDRGLAAGEERYEVQRLAQRTGLSTDEARELIERFGNDREMLEREANRLRRH